MEGGLDHVGLNLEVLADKIGGKLIIRLDTTYPGCRQVDRVNFFISKKGLHFLLTGQVELRMGPGQQLPLAGLFKAPDQG